MSPEGLREALSRVVRGVNEHQVNAFTDLVQNGAADGRLARTLVTFSDWIKSNPQSTEEFFPSHVGVAADHKEEAVTASEFRFQRVDSSLCLIPLIFNNRLIDQANVLLGNDQVAVQMCTAKGRLEGYLFVLHHLTAKTWEELGLASAEAQAALVWESLARVDSERNGQEIDQVTTNVVCRQAFSAAQAFLAQRQMAPMRQSSLAQRDGRERPAGLWDGQGGKWQDQINRLYEADDGVRVLYSHVRRWVQEELGEDLEVLRGMDIQSSDQSWMRINGAHNSFGLITVAQVLQERVLASGGVDIVNDYKIVAGESQGSMSAAASAGLFGSPKTPLLVPDRISGFRTLESIEVQVRIMCRMGKFQHKGTPAAGPKTQNAVQPIGIPYSIENPDASILGRLSAAINVRRERLWKKGEKKTGKAGYVGVGVVNTLVDQESGKPLYWVVMHGTQDALEDLNQFILKARDGKWPIGFEEDRELFNEVWGYIQENKEAVGEPKVSRTLGLSISPHDPNRLGPVKDEFLRNVESSGLLSCLASLRIPVACNSRKGSFDISRDPKEIFTELVDEIFTKPVLMPYIAQELLESGATSVVTLGPGDPAANFTRKNQNKIPVLGIDNQEDRLVLETRVPSEYREVRAEKPKVIAVHKEDAATEVAKQFAAIPGISAIVESRDGKSVVRVVVESVTGPKGESLQVQQEKSFEAAIEALGDGFIPTLLQSNKIGGKLNRLTLLGKPLLNRTLEIHLDEAKGVSQFNILERDRVAVGMRVSLLSDGAQGVAVTEYTYPHGDETQLNRQYAFIPQSDGSHIVNNVTDPKKFRKESREAYAKDWGMSAEGKTAKSEFTSTNTGGAGDAFDYNQSVGASHPRLVENDHSLGQQGHPNYSVKRHWDALMSPLFLDEFDFDMTTVIDESLDVTQHKPWNPQLETRVVAKVIRVEDFNDGKGLSGRRMIRHSIEYDREGNKVSEAYSSAVSRGLAELKAGETQVLYEVKDSEKPVKHDFLSGRIVYKNKDDAFVEVSEIAIPENAADIYPIDQNRNHISDASAQLSNNNEGRFMQGQNVFARVNEAIVGTVTKGDFDRYLGVQNLVFMGFVKPGEKLQPQVRRICNAEGVHQYEVTVTSSSGRPVMAYTLYANGPKTLFMFSGQGDQHPGMDVEIKKSEYRAALLRSDIEIMRAIGSDVDLEDALKRGSSDTRETQPMYGTYGAAYIADYRAKGLVPRDAAFTGHSVGMGLALYAAGLLTRVGLLKFLSKRGNIMSQCIDPDNPQSMMAVTNWQGTLGELKALAREVSIYALNSTEGELISITEVANVNSNLQTVVSGHVSALSRFKEKIKQVQPDNLSLTQVPVRTGFHTSIMHPAADEMRDFLLEEKLFGSGNNPVFMDTIADYLPDDPAVIAELMARQIKEAIDFNGTIKKALVEGYRRFVTLGPSQRGTLTTFVTRIADSLGIPLEEIEILDMNEECAPDDWAAATFDAAPAVRASKKVSKQNQVPVTRQELSAPELHEVDVEEVEVRQVRRQSAQDPRANWKSITVKDLRETARAMATTLVGQKDLNDLTGATYTLFEELVKKGKTVNIEEEAYAILVARIIEQTYKPLTPGALEALEAHIAFLKGVVEEESPVVASPLWTREDILSRCKELIAFAFNRDIGQLGDAVVFEDIGIDSNSFAEKASPHIPVIFEVSIMDDLKKIKTMNDLVENVLKRLTNPDKVNIKNPQYKNLMALKLQVEQRVSEIFAEAKRKAEEAARTREQAGNGAPGMTDEEKQALKEDWLKAAQEKAEAALQEQAERMVLALGGELSHMKKVRVTVDGKMVGLDTRVDNVSQRALANVERNAGEGFVRQMQPTYNPAFAYGFGQADQLGGEQSLHNLMADLNAGNLPKDPDTLTRRVNHLANQIGQSKKLIERLVFFLETERNEDKLRVIRPLLERARKVEKEGPQFDNVVSINAVRHEAVYGEDIPTRAVSRGRNTQQTIEDWAGLADPKSIEDARYLTTQGYDMRGIDVVVAGAGAIGEPDIIKALQLGARVIVLDYKGRNARLRDGRYASAYYMELARKWAINPELQLVIEPNFKLGNDTDNEALAQEMISKGYNPQVFINAAALGHYGPIDSFGEPYEMSAVYGVGTQQFLTKFARHYQKEAEAKKGDATYKRKQIVFVNYPTINPDNKIAFSNKYGNSKAWVHPGLIPNQIFNDGLRYDNDDPIVVEVASVTTWTNKDTVEQTGASQKIMEDNQTISDSAESRALSEYGIKVRMTNGDEQATITWGSVVRVLRARKEGQPVNRLTEYKNDFGMDRLGVAVANRHRKPGAHADPQDGRLTEFLDQVRRDETKKHDEARRRKVATRTDPVHIPNDGSLFNPNRLRDHVFIRGAREGVLAETGHEVLLHPDTQVVLGGDSIGVAGAGGLANLRWMLAESGHGTIGKDKEWLFQKDVWTLVRGLGKVIAKTVSEKKLDISKMSAEDMWREFGSVIRDKTGFQTSEDGLGFETRVAIKAPSDLPPFQISKDMLMFYQDSGYTIEYDTRGNKTYASVKKGQEIRINVKAPLEVTVWGNLPAGRDFDVHAHGLTSNLDADSGAMAGHMSKMTFSGALAQMGASPQMVQAYHGSENMGVNVSNAYPDAIPTERMNHSRRNVAGAPRKTDMAASLEDQSAGQINRELWGGLLVALAVVAACSTGSANIYVAVKMAHQLMADVIGGRTTLAQALLRIMYSGSADFAATDAMLMGFIACDALIPDAVAEALGLPKDQRSRPDTPTRSGFVPGVTGGGEIHNSYDASKAAGWNFNSAIIAANFGADGEQSGAREAYGQGLLRTALKTIDEAMYDPVHNPRGSIRDPNDVVWVIKKHGTSTPLGDKYEMAVLKIVTAYLEKRYGLHPGTPVYLETSKEYNGHGLGGASGFDSGTRPHSIAHRVVVGHSTLDQLAYDQYAEMELDVDIIEEGGVRSVYPVGMNCDLTQLDGELTIEDVREEVVQDGVITRKARAKFKVKSYQENHCVFSNQSIDLDLVHGNKPIAVLTMSAGFNEKNTAVIEVEVKRDYGSLEEAIEGETERFKQYLLGRAQLRAIREGKRPLVQYINQFKLIPVSEYEDLRALHSRARAIVERLLRDGQTFDFDHADRWVYALPRDAGSEPSHIDRAFDRVYEVAAKVDPAKIERIRQEAARRETAKQPLLFNGMSQGMGFNTLIELIEAGAVKEVCGIFKEMGETPEQQTQTWNVKALEAYAASKGVRLKVFDVNAIIASSKFDADGNRTLAVEALPEEVVTYVEAMRERCEVKDLNWIDTIAFGKPARASGSKPGQAVSINAAGQMFVEDIMVMGSVKEDYNATIDKMGLNHGAWDKAMGARGWFGPRSIRTHANWRNGKNGKVMGGIYYQQGALLGIAKDFADEEIHQTRIEHPEWGDSVNLDYPAFMSFALGQIPGGWLFGLIGQKVLEEKTGCIEMHDLAANALIGLLSRTEAQRANPNDYHVDADSHEAAVLDEISSRYEIIKAKAEAFVRDHADQLIQDPDNEKRRYIPASIVRDMLGNLVPERYLDVLAAHIPDDWKLAQKLEMGDIEMLGGASAVNSSFEAPRMDGEIQRTHDAGATVLGISFDIPESYTGYSGVTHGGMVDGIFEAAFEKLQQTLHLPAGSYRREITYRANTPPNTEVEVRLKRTASGWRMMLRERGGSNTLYAEAHFRSLKRVSSDKNTIRFTYIGVDGTEVTHEQPRRTDLKLTQLKGDRTFTCLPHCVAAGHRHDTGLKFKYAFDNNQNVIWGVLDGIQESRNILPAVLLAADDMAAWCGVRSCGKWGFTGNNIYHPVREPRPGERLFILTQVVERSEEVFPITVQVVNAHGEVVGVLTANYAVHDEAMAKGIRGAIEAARNATADDRNVVARTMAFLQASMGSSFETLRSRLSFELLSAAPPPQPMRTNFMARSGDGHRPGSLTIQQERAYAGATLRGERPVSSLVGSDLRGRWYRSGNRRRGG